MVFNISRLAFAGFFALFATPLAAVPVTYDFTANIPNVAAELQAAGFNINAVTGSFSYDTNGTDEEASPAVGEYDDALTSVFFEDPSGMITGSSASGFVVTENDNPRDVFSVAAVASALTGSSLTGFELANLRVFLEDNSQTALLSDELPIDLNFSLFVDERIFTLGYQRTLDGEVFFARGELTSLTRRPTEVIPEPATLPLFASAVLLLGLRRRH